MPRITSTDFARAVQSITPSAGWSSRVAVAVSGGPDSIALLHLMAQHAREERKRLVAVTVDHRLREGSTAEAAGVKTFATLLGLDHHTLTVRWGHPPYPAFPELHRTEAPARSARLLLYRDLFRREGLSELWTGHHRGDQVENLLMRGRGMASMARLESGSLEEDEDVERWVVRPLLGFDKEPLVEYCHEHVLPYVIDPTNVDPLHTPRNALRQSLALSQARHLSHPHVLPSATSYNSGPLHLLHQVLPPLLPPSPPSPPPADLISLNSPLPSTLTLRPGLLPAHTPPSKVRALLRRVIAFVSPLPSPSISEAALELARRRIWEPSTEDSGKTAFTPGAGVLFRPIAREGGTDWVVGRQPPRGGATRKLLELRDGEGRTWDGRVWLKVDLTRVKEEGESHWVEGRGRWSMPVVLRRTSEGREEVLLDLGRKARGEMIEVEGNIELDGVRMSWRCRKKLR